MARFIKWKRFRLALLGMLAILLINTAGLYGNGFVARYYWVSQAEHFAAGLLLAMLFSSLHYSKRSIFIWVAVLGMLWEFFEYAVVYSPVISGLVNKVLIMDGLVLTWKDTTLDFILNLSGAVLFVAIFRREEK